MAQPPMAQVVTARVVSQDIERGVYVGELYDQQRRGLVEAVVKEVMVREVTVRKVGVVKIWVRSVGEVISLVAGGA